MSAGYWSALQILNQTAGELGLPQVTTVTGLTDVQSLQLLALLNSAGNELLTYYPWEQFVKEWEFTTEIDKAEYELPADYSYFRDQTQWDRTNHWPLLGPKSAQEWAWLKGSLVAPLPRLRYRIANNLFKIYPTPTTNSSPAEFTLAMEYIQRNWVLQADGTTEADLVTQNGDTVKYNPWLVIKYVKFKFYDLKGFDTTGTQRDFLRIFNSLTGKDTGAQKLSLSGNPAPVGYIGPWSVPDGSWNVYP